MAEICNKTIWVVGASSGIGFELVKQLAEANNYIYVTARSIANLEKLNASYPKNVNVLSGDITDTGQLSRMGDDLNERTDILDMMIFCAGTCEYDDGPQLDVALYRRVFDVNFFATVSCIKIALPLLKRSGGTVVGVTSLASVVPFPRAEAYGASKIALEYFLDSLRIDLSDSGVSVVKVRPGFVDTPLTQKNDFDMPFIVDVTFAAKKIIRGLALNKSTIDFPWKLSLLLKFFSYFKCAWMWLAAKQFRRSQQL